MAVVIWPSVVVPVDEVEVTVPSEPMLSAVELAGTVIAGISG